MSLRIFKRASTVLAACFGAGLLAAPAFADPGDFVGEWHNVDPNTQSIAAVKIHQAWFGIDVHTYGACSPQACDWGSVHGHFINGDTVEAKYTTGFSIVWLTLHRDWHHKLDFKTHTHFTDNSGRPDYDSNGELAQWGGWGPGGPGSPGGPGWGPGGPGGPSGPGGPGPGGPSLGSEDCIGFDPGQVTAA